MKKLFCLVLGLLCFCFLMGCEEKGQSPLPSSTVSQMPQTLEQEKPTPVEPSVPEENQFGALGVEIPEQDDETTNELKELIMAVVMCDYADGMQFDATNSNFFWRAMNYYTASICYDYDALSGDKSWALFPEEQVMYFATRLFGGVDSLPELLDTGMIELREDGYAFALGNYGDVSIQLGEITAQEDGYMVEATLVTSDGENLGSWQILLTQIAGEYCITGILYG